MKKLIWGGVALLFCTTGVFAQTYRWVDKEGHTIISDKQPPGAVKVVKKAEAEAPDQIQLPFALKQASTNFPVTLYSTTDCTKVCDDARDLLYKRGTPFLEKVITNEASKEELKALVGDVFVPTLKIGREVLRGFNATKYDEALDLAGYPRVVPEAVKERQKAPPPATPDIIDLDRDKKNRPY